LRRRVQRAAVGGEQGRGAVAAARAGAPQKLAGGGGDGVHAQSVTKMQCREGRNVYKKLSLAQKKMVEGVARGAFC
jgi:hypothetical protein